MGLVAGVFTRDLDRATRAAQQLRAGQIFVNEWYAGGVETPFGGYGRSGYGREKGREALWNYVQTKNIAVRLPKLNRHSQGISAQTCCQAKPTMLRLASENSMPIW